MSLIDETIKSVVESYRGQIHTSEPAKVVSFSGGEFPTVTATPVTRSRILKSDGTYFTQKRVPIPNVPVMYPSGGGFYISWPLKAGDDVLLVYCERSISGWKKSGDGDQEPVASRRHDLRDAIAIPMGRPEVTTDMVLKGDIIRLGSKDAAHPLALGDVVQELFRLLLELLSTAQPVGNMGLPVPFATDVSGRAGNGMFAGGIMAVSTALQPKIDESVSEVSKTE